MDLIDAIAGHVVKESTVSVYRTCLDAIIVPSLMLLTIFSGKKANTNSLPNELKENQMEITQLIAEECPNTNKRSFRLFLVFH